MLIRILAAAAFALAGAAPSIALSQPTMVTAPGATQRPTQAEVQTAMKAANPSFHQKRELKPMVDMYKNEMTNAPNEQSKQIATHQFMVNLKSVLTPAQQTAFKESLMSQMGAGH